MAFGFCKNCLFCRTHKGQSFRQLALENDFKSKSLEEIDYLVQEYTKLYCCKHAPTVIEAGYNAEFPSIFQHDVVVNNCGCGEFARATNSNDPIPKK